MPQPRLLPCLSVRRDIKGTPMKKVVKRMSLGSAAGPLRVSMDYASDTYACSKHRIRWDAGRAFILRP